MEIKQFKIFTKDELDVMHLQILREIGREMGVKSPTSKQKDQLIDYILGVQSGKIAPSLERRGAPTKKQGIDLTPYYATYEQNGDIKNGFRREDSLAVVKNPETATAQAEEPNKSFVVKGVFEQHPNGYGFIRTNQGEVSKDVYVSKYEIKKYDLRNGDIIKATAKFIHENNSAAMQEILLLNGEDAEIFLRRSRFDDLIPYYPTDRIKLEGADGDDLALRAIDLFAPIGMGQRGLIVAPPKTGKTTVMKRMAQSIEKNYPDVKLFILLVDERPEEVTDFSRSVNAEVVASTFDEGAEHHVKVAESVINKAKRLVESGKNVVILMDSITKLARAYNTTVVSSGKTLSGGIDPTALQPPKRFFGTARNIENGGSLTIISTALVETGSRMDDVIYEEFKGTGNMEIHLTRSLSEKRIFPAIDLYKSGTRREELLLSEKELDAVFKLRKILAERDDATESLLEMIKKTKNNAEFLEKVNLWIDLYKNSPKN